MIKLLLRLFRRRPVVVNNFKVKRTDYEKLKQETHARLRADVDMRGRS